MNYVYNLTEANLTPNRRPHWFQLYDLKNNFGLSDLSANSMDDLTHRMVTSNRFLLDLYSAYFSKLSDRRWPYCDDNCKINNLCKIVTTVLWRREKCDELRRLFYSMRSTWFNVYYLQPINKCNQQFYFVLCKLYTFFYYTNGHLCLAR